MTTISSDVTTDRPTGSHSSEIAPIPTTAFCVYQTITDRSLTRDYALLSFEFWSGPYPTMKLAVRAVESLKQADPEGYASLVITHYHGEHWSYHFEQPGVF